MGVSNDHPWFQRDYDDINVSIHGGLTYAGFGVGKVKEDTDLCWVGFDTANWQDTMHTCSKEYCERELESLKQQAIDALNEPKT